MPSPARRGPGSARIESGMGTEGIDRCLILLHLRAWPPLELSICYTRRIQSLLDRLLGAARSQGASKSELARRAGIPPVELSQPLRRGDLRASTLARLAAALDLELTLTPADTRRRATDAIRRGNFFGLNEQRTEVARVRHAMICSRSGTGKCRLRTEGRKYLHATGVCAFLRRSAAREQLQPRPQKDRRSSSWRRPRRAAPPLASGFHPPPRRHSGIVRPRSP